MTPATADAQSVLLLLAILTGAALVTAALWGLAYVAPVAVVMLQRWWRTRK